MLKLFSLLLLSVFFTREVLAEDAPWKVGYKDGGGGVYWASADDNLKINILGYAQTLQKWYMTPDYKSRNDYPLAFSVRRARLDFGATVMKDHTLFIEYDGAPATNTTPGSESGFGLVEAHTTSRLLEDKVQLRLGKYVVPFSTENYRSSRAYDTVERYMVLSSMFADPAFDTQYGGMVMGKLLEKNALAYYVSVTNGNAKASANYPERNNSKEYTARVNYDLYNDPGLREQLTIGAAYDYDDEGPQTITLYDLAGGAYNTLPVTGVRKGIVLDALFVKGPLSLRTEFMDVRWTSAPGSPGIDGGFLQAGYFLKGSESGGFQALLRGELAQLHGPTGTADARQLTAVVAGWQWFLNANVRHQLNFVTTLPEGGSAAGVYENNRATYALLSEMQIKF